MPIDTLQALELDREAASFMATLSIEPSDNPGVAALVTIERLRRLEDQVRCSGATRQTFQKIASARRVLGDQTSFGPIKGPFLPD